MFEQPSEQPPSRESWFTEDVLRVFAAARDEALTLNHHYLGTEHLLLGLMGQPNSRASRALASDTDLESARAQVRKLVGVGQGLAGGELPMTPRVKRVLRFARREADQYRVEQITPEHLLIGILREGEGIGTQVLLAVRADFGRIRSDITKQWRRDTD